VRAAVGVAQEEPVLVSAIGEVLGLAVAIAVNPVGIILITLILLSDRARANGVAFAVGWCVSILGVAALGYGLADLGDADVQEGTSDGIDAVRIVLGLALWALAAWQWRRRPAPGEHRPEPRVFARVATLSAAGALVAGVLTAVVNVKTAPLALSAGATFAQSGLAGTSAWVALITFTLVASAGVLVPLVAVLVLGERSREPLLALKTWLQANASVIGIVLLVLIGAVLIGNGLALAGR
jgi:hypothetical protein